MNDLETPQSSTTTQVGHNDGVVSFPEEANTMEHLFHHGSNLDVIAIVGMPGIGKTTLASHLYNTPSVVNRFDILAWCAVSQSYQLRALLLSILHKVNPPEKSHTNTHPKPDSSISKVTLSNMDDEALADHLRKSLKQRRYLIVLDDIWDAALWNYLKRYLPDDRNGSRILITTRNRDVADQIGSKVNELHELSEASSWELFQKKMLHKESVPDHLLQIAKGIVKHCKGLPLSIVIIAGILSDMKRTKKKWNQIAESVSSIVLSDPQGKCTDILRLSYSHLPDQLRLCFLYLGSFPEDQEISVQRLIIRWIGEGLVGDTELESAEEVAKKHIDDLIVKSLVIPAKERLGGGVKTVRLHDLLRDFCLRIAMDDHFLTLLNNRNDYPPPLQDPSRLITYGPWIDDLSFSCHNIRSMICYSKSKASQIENRIRSCDTLLFELLEIEDISSKRFPDISILVCLRYMALRLLDRNREITVLPSSISKLQSLEILILKFDHPIEVPDFIWDMVKLRHVDISEEATFQVESTRLEKSSFLLENLRSLSKARVSWVDSKWESKCLRKLSGLQTLSCVFVEYDSDAGSDEEDAIDMDDIEVRMLRFNDHLTSLKVRNDADWNQEFLNTCRLPSDLRELTVSKFYLRDISEIGRAVRHLEVLEIYNCSVPSGYQWNVGDGDFPKLRVLKLRGLQLCKWITSGNFYPELEQLWVEKCNRIMEVPVDFGNLPKLRLISIRKCEPSLDDSAREIEREQEELSNTELRVRIYPRKS